MPRYLVERTFPHHLAIPVDAVVELNADEGVTWLHSYVSDDRRRTFCVYEAPSPEAIRKTAARSALPVDRITEVHVLNPHSFSWRTGERRCNEDSGRQAQRLEEGE